MKRKGRIVLSILMVFSFWAGLHSSPARTFDPKRLLLFPKILFENSWIGEWELVEALCFVGEKVVSPKISPKREEGILRTTMVLDSLQQFIITQSCLKCPLIEFRGNYNLDTMSLSGQRAFYLTFQDPRGIELTQGFNGVITRLEKDTLLLRNKEQCTMRYERVSR
jgi:hypothetical protein